MTFAQSAWLNKPAVWRLDKDVLTVTTDRSTDSGVRPIMGLRATR